MLVSPLEFSLLDDHLPPFQELADLSFKSYETCLMRSVGPSLFVYPALFDVDLFV